MAKKQHRTSHSIGPEGEALLRKLTSHESMLVQAIPGTGTGSSKPGTASNTIELMIRRTARQLGVTVTDEEIEAAKRHPPAKSSPADPVADLRALEHAFGPKFSG